MLVVGKARGRLRGDEHLSKALLTVAQLMGSTATELGMDAGNVTAPLSGVQV